MSYEQIKERDTEECLRCGECSEVCPADCFEIQVEEDDFTACAACGQCLDVCPADAIVINND